MNRNLVFVYGTLRKGASNHFRMSGSEWLGAGSVSGRIYEVTLNPEFLYPALITDEAGRVLGDLFFVSDELLSELDVFEGISPDPAEPDEYRRIEISVKLESGIEHIAWAWEWNSKLENARLLETGDWLAYEPDPS